MRPRMFIAGVRKFDRVRGDGWLDCPNCHEHAAQDVVDEMRFASLVFYRFTPISRHRILRCRRCGFRRPATVEEMSTLKTAGRRVGRAWLAPVGLSPFIAVILAIGVIALRSGTTASAGRSFTTVTADPVAPVSMQIPSEYNHSAIPAESSDSAGEYTAGTEQFTMRLRRYPTAMSPQDTLSAHFDDDAGLNQTGFPSKAPSGTSTKIAGQDALHATINYTQTGGAAVIDLYVFNHNGVAYMLSFQYLGTVGAQEAATVVPKIVDSLKFTSSETPPPSASASPGSSSSTSSGSSSSTSSSST